MTIREAYEATLAKRKQEYLTMQKKWLLLLHNQIENQQLIDLRPVFADFSQDPFQTNGGIFCHPELEEIAARLIDWGFCKLTEVVYYDQENVVWVHPEIAIKYIEILSRVGGWQAYTVHLSESK